MSNAAEQSPAGNLAASVVAWEDEATPSKHLRNPWALVHHLDLADSEAEASGVASMIAATSDQEEEVLAVETVVETEADTEEDAAAMVVAEEVSAIRITVCRQTARQLDRDQVAVMVAVEAMTIEEADREMPTTNRSRHEVGIEIVMVEEVATEGRSVHMMAVVGMMTVDRGEGTDDTPLNW